MFDISWTEFLLIGVVALIVIGPKELPGVLRTLGQWTRKVRSMAAEFQNQFQEAMREAEMADLKKQVDEMAQDIKNYDPLKDVREDVEAAGRDIQTSLSSKPEAKPALPTTPEPELPPVEAAIPVTPVERNSLETVGAGAAAPAPAEPATGSTPPDTTGRPA